MTLNSKPFRPVPQRANIAADRFLLVPSGFNAGGRVFFHTMSIKIMSAVWGDNEITNRSELLVLLALADFSNDYGVAWPGIERIAQKSRHTDRAVQKVLYRLMTRGKLEIRRGGQGPQATNEYRIRVNGVHPSEYDKGEQMSMLRVNGGANKGERTEPKTEPAGSPESSLTVSTRINRHKEPSLELVSDRSIEDRVVREVDASVIYDQYPRKVGRPQALKAIEKQLRKFGFQRLKLATMKFAAVWKGRDLQFCPHPTTWFNGERFNDDPSTWQPSVTNGKGEKHAADWQPGSGNL